jgi:hypothetical protein
MMVRPAENTAAVGKPFVRSLEQLSHVPAAVTDGIEHANYPATGYDRIDRHPDLSLIQLERLCPRLGQGMSERC